MNLGKADAARGFLEDARRVDPTNYRLHAILGSIAESEDRTADASTNEISRSAICRTVFRKARSIRSSFV